MRGRYSKMENAEQTAAASRVLIADDAKVIRERLRLLIKDCANLELVAEAEDAQSALRLFDSKHPEIVVLDIRMPDRSGIAVLEQIKQQAPATKVVMLTNYPYSAYRRRCIQLGACAFLDKSTEFEKIQQVLGECAKGRITPVDREI